MGLFQDLREVSLPGPNEENMRTGGPGKVPQAKTRRVVLSKRSPCSVFCFLLVAGC